MTKLTFINTTPLIKLSRKRCCAAFDITVISSRPSFNSVLEYKTVLSTGVAVPSNWSSGV